MNDLNRPVDLLQATYIHADHGLAWWGPPNVVDLLTRIGLSPGRPATLRLAGPNGTVVTGVETSARITDIGDVVPELSSVRDTQLLDHSALVWRTACICLPDLMESKPQVLPRHLEMLAASLPPAGHAVLNADETSMMSPLAVLTQFCAALHSQSLQRDARLKADLRPYQAHGIAWLTAKAADRQGAVLADEMGLGKTLQAIGAIAARPAGGIHLVVCPTSLLGNWIRELGRFAPHLPVIRHHGSGRELAPPLPANTVVVTSYPLLRTDPALTQQEWDLVVFDEAQNLKNPATRVTRSALKVSATSRIAMTGTPIENRLDELWSLFSVTNPGLLGTRDRFRRRFQAPIQQRRSATAAAALSELISPHLLRRTKDRVATELPPRLDSTVVCTMTREQADLYRAAVDATFSNGLGSGIGRRGRVLALITSLKQICNHPAQFLKQSSPDLRRSGKFDRAIEMLTEITHDDQRALVFTQYRRMGHLLATAIGDQLGVAIPFLHGGLTVHARDNLVRDFQEDAEAPPVLILSLRAAGFGLNLTRASHVLHYDRWWNPAVEEQATARAHRIGQDRTLNVHTLIAAGTIEDHIDRMHQEKRGIAEVITGNPADALANLPDAQLRDILTLNLEEAVW